STWCAPASSAFSTSSFTTEAGRSTTSPAAIWPWTAGGRTAIRPTPLQDEARVLARDPGLHLLALLLEAGAAHEAVRETLALLDAWLTERVDPREQAGRDRRALEQIDELAERERIQLGKHDRRARTPALRERELRRALLGVHEFRERASAEI